MQPGCTHGAVHDRCGRYPFNTVPLCEFRKIPVRMRQFTISMGKKLLIGTDEAGYGPNLGPLVITATVWKMPAENDCRMMWDLLSDVLTNCPVRDDRRLHVADSKQVYTSTTGIVGLETGVLCFLKSLGLTPTDARQLGTAVAGQAFATEFELEPAATIPPPCLPTQALPDEIDEHWNSLQIALSAADMQLQTVRSRILFPREFNALVNAADSKGTVLTECTLALIRDACTDPDHGRSSDRPGDSSAPGKTEVYSDKHGGRNRYDQAISAAFSDQFVFRLQESTEVSRYRMAEMDFCFRAKAEELLPVALASMVSKYLREILMIHLNQFWQQHVPGLRPTKGYPVDARRFRQDISAATDSLQISEDRLWRCR